MSKQPSKIKGISVASRKAKGRNLQKWVAGEVLKAFPSLTELDVKSTAMGSGGVDVQLSTAALALFPYAVEAKNQEKLKTVYDMYAQAASHKQGGEPLLIIKMNGQKPLAIVDAAYFIKKHGV